MKNSYFFFKTNDAVFFLSLLIGFGSIAQTVGIGTNNPQSSLDIQGVNNNGAITASDGLLAPRVNGLATAGSQNGQLVYLIADSGNLKKGFYNWNGSNWKPLALNGGPNGVNTLVLPDVSYVNSFTLSPGTAINNINNVFNTRIPVDGIIGNTSLVTLSIDINHTRDQDLDIFLISPTGQILELTTDNGGNNDDYSITTFSDAATTNITAGPAPFNGSFRPEGTNANSGAPVNRIGTITTLAGFNGFNPNGDWILRIGDDTNGQNGTLNSVTLNIGGSAHGNWVLIGESSMTYLNDTANIVKSTYSADPADLNGVVTAITRTTATAGALGNSVSTLPATILNYSSASPSAKEDFWVNTFNQTRDIGLVDNTVYFYQLWRKGNIETPVASNETFSLVPIRIEQ